MIHLIDLACDADRQEPTAAAMDVTGDDAVELVLRPVLQGERGRHDDQPKRLRATPASILRLRLSPTRAIVALDRLRRYSSTVSDRLVVLTCVLDAAGRIAARR
jgi:hypothetical protein